MPKHKVDSAQALKEVKAAWSVRGYRPDFLATHQHERDEDPHGELAYQRAFAEAAKKEPPRLPNPSHYPKSPSALAFLQQQNKKFFNTRPTNGPNPKYESPIPDMYWRSKEEELRFRSASSTPPSAQHATPPPQHFAFPQQNGHGYLPPTSGSKNPPLLLEPKIGAPMGPPSRFR